MNEEFEVEFDEFDREVDGPELSEDFDLDSDEDTEYYEHDDMFDIESALGSAGWGTDEYYGGWE